MGRAVDLADRFHSGTLSIRELFHFLADDVVTGHILEADQAFFPFLAGTTEG
jgi:hypothetical protein